VCLSVDSDPGPAKDKGHNYKRKSEISKKFQIDQETQKLAHSRQKRRSQMAKSLTISALIATLGAIRCTSQAEFLTSKQPTVIQAAVSRADNSK
jgi:hypothetical protein